MAEGSARPANYSYQDNILARILGVCVRTNAAARDNYITAGQIIAAAGGSLKVS
jgi:hypothetical protein